MSATETVSQGESVQAVESRQREGFAGFASQYSLVAVLILTLVVFSLLKSQSYGTFANYKSIISINIPDLFVALAATLPFIVGEFDLSVANVAILSEVLFVGLVELQHLNVILAILIALAAAAAVGVINGVAIAIFRFSSFIVTLAMASLVAGIFLAYTNAQTVFGIAPPSMTSFSRSSLWGIPLPIYYGIIVTVILALVLGRTPLGRRMYATGSNQRAALLTGIPTRRYVIWTFVAGSLLAGCGGIILGSTLGSAAPDTSGALLIPAFAGAFLGATAFMPGRFNVPGTFVAVYLVASVLAGLQQYGAAQWVPSAFEGAILFIAVILQTWTTRARARAAAASRLKELTESQGSEQGV